MAKPLVTHELWALVEPLLPPEPRKRPEKLHTDKGYDFRRCREALRQRGITRASVGAGSTQVSA